MLDMKEHDLMEVERSLEAVNPKKAQGKVWNFCNDFKEHFQRSIQGQEVRLTTASARGKFRAPSKFTYTSEEYGHTFEYEYGLTPYGDNEEWSIPLAELTSPQHLGNPGQQLGENLKRKLLGVSSFDRAVDTFQYMLLARPFPDIPDDDIVNAGNAAGSVKGRFPTDEVVMQMATRHLSEANPGVEWLSEFLLRHFSDHAEEVFQKLMDSEEYRSLPRGVKDLLERNVLGRFKVLLRERLENAMEQFAQVVETLEEFRPIDKIRKQLMLQLSLLDDGTLVSKSMLRSQLAFSGVSNSLVSVNVEKQGVYPSAEEVPKFDPAPRNLQVLGALQEIGQSLGQLAGQFNFADMVGSGWTQLLPQDPNMLDFAYLRSCAKKYYYSFVFEMIDDIKRIWTKEFLHFLTSIHRDEISVEIKNMADHIVSLPDGEWSDAMGGQGQEAWLKSEIHRIKVEIQDLQSAVRTMHRHSPPPMNSQERSENPRGLRGASQRKRGEHRA